MYRSQHNQIFVFDIETVPDLEAARNLLGDDVPEEELGQKLVEYHLKATDHRNSFLRQPFHKVVAISFLEASIENTSDGERYLLKDLRSGGTLDSDESELIAGFFKYLDSRHARLISFNGRTFDLPVLKYRAMLHGVSAPWLYKRGDKWNSYNSRFSLDWHCDLLDAFSDFGASARVKMHEVCALLGLPGKLDVDGSKVEDMYNNGEVEEIRNYCELDVINTYLLYLCYMKLTGNVSELDYNQSVESLISYLKEQAESSKPHYKDFLKAMKFKY